MPETMAITPDSFHVSTPILSQPPCLPRLNTSGPSPFSLPFTAQIIFSAIEKKKKEGESGLPPEEGEGLQDAAAESPGELPPPLHKPLKNLSTTF